MRLRQEASSPFLKKRTKKLSSFADIVSTLETESSTSISQGYKSLLLLFFRKEGLAFLSFALLLAPCHADEVHQTCVDVTVGTAQSYSCLNERLAALAHQQHRDSAAPSAPYSANSPGNVTGQFNESATRNRLGANFGRSVTPERPAAPPHATLN